MKYKSIKIHLLNLVFLIMIKVKENSYLEQL